MCVSEALARVCGCVCVCGSHYDFTACEAIIWRIHKPLWRQTQSRSSLPVAATHTCTVIFHTFMSYQNTGERKVWLSPEWTVSSSRHHHHDFSTTAPVNRHNSEIREHFVFLGPAALSRHRESLFVTLFAHPRGGKLFPSLSWPILFLFFRTRHASNSQSELRCYQRGKLQYLVLEVQRIHYKTEP